MGPQAKGASSNSTEQNNATNGGGVIGNSVGGAGGSSATRAPAPTQEDGERMVLDALLNIGSTTTTQQPQHQPQHQQPRRQQPGGAQEQQAEQPPQHHPQHLSQVQPHAQTQTQTQHQSTSTPTSQGPAPATVQAQPQTHSNIPATLPSALADAIANIMRSSAAPSGTVIPQPEAAAASPSSGAMSEHDRRSSLSVTDSMHGRSAPGAYANGHVNGAHATNAHANHSVSHGTNASATTNTSTRQALLNSANPFAAASAAMASNPLAHMRNQLQAAALLNNHSILHRGGLNSALGLASPSSHAQLLASTQGLPPSTLPNASLILQQLLQNTSTAAASTPSITVANRNGPNTQNTSASANNNNNNHTTATNVRPQVNDSPNQQVQQATSHGTTTSTFRPSSPQPGIKSPVAELQPSSMSLLLPSPAKRAGVCKDKVEAALRSKPQRGRKRNDLSELDRLELTRTRNREHAKSTRMRKKVRYQELEESEQRLKKLEGVQQLQQSRRKLFRQFVERRIGMMTAACQQSAKRNFDRKKDNGESESDSNNSGSGNEDDATTDTTDHVRVSLNDLITNEESFHCTMDHISSMPSETDQSTKVKPFSSSSTLSSSSSLASTISPRLAPMHMWDAELAAQIRIHNIFPPSAPHRLGYHIEGDDYGVACTDDNRCFGLVHISQALEDKGAAPTNNRLLLAGVLIVHFVPASTKITTAQWHTTTNCIPELNPQQRTYATAGLATDQQQQRHAQGGLRSGDDAATQGQLSTNAKSDGDDATNAVEDGATKDIHIDRVYSSVVSLERHGDIDPGNGVGMNI